MSGHGGAAGTAAPPATVSLTAADRDLLLYLLELPTAGAMETGDDGPGPRLWQAQRAYAEAAAELGATVLHHAAPDPAVLTADAVPLAVRRAARQYPGFLADQPSLVLRLGPPAPRARTVMFNVHLDTVAGLPPVRFADDRFHGRGAIDAKGPAVALLAGLRAALAAGSGIGSELSVLVQVVAGEEGGAMGVFGTRPLVEAGYVGRVNLFCEPTRGRLLTRSTAAMTPCLVVEGDDAIDDRPYAGHNATVLLGFLAQYLAAELPRVAGDATVCVAGLRTGPAHNRVYGSGRLLLNLAYDTPEAGQALGTTTERLVAEGLAEFSRRFAGVRELARTAAEAAEVTRVEWQKRGLPALAPADDRIERLLVDGAGLPRWPVDEPAFTCDAIWLHGVPDTLTGVYGPGDLDRNHAHAVGEYADLADLERFAAGVARVLDHLTRSGDGMP